MKRIFFLLFILILFVSCSKKIEVFNKYDFNTGDYVLYGLISMGGPTEFTDRVGDFKIQDVSTLKRMQSDWVLYTTNRRMPCGYSYDFFLMKGDSCVNKFSANLECKYIIFYDFEGWYNFPPKLLHKYEKSMIKISEEEAREFMKNRKLE